MCMLFKFGQVLNEKSPILVIDGPNVTLLRFGLYAQTLSSIVPAALNVTLSNGFKSQPNTPIFKQTGLFITIVLTLLFPLNGK